jgi:hypothetical protein
VAPIRRVEYVPYEQRYIEYVEQRIKVPVQKVTTDYYQIEHITDYMPIEKEEVVYELQPQEVVTMRLQYVPVEQYSFPHAGKSYTSVIRTRRHSASRST